MVSVSFETWILKEQRGGKHYIEGDVRWREFCLLIVTYERLKHV